MKRQKIYPRLCVIKNWGTSYGFSLTSKKLSNGQEYHYINDVVETCSAGYAGLQKQDRLIEVNGACVENESHKQIVKRILTNSRSVSLLVLTESDFILYRKSGYPSSALIPYATIIESPDHKPSDPKIKLKPHSHSLKECMLQGTDGSNGIMNQTYRLEDLVLRSDSWTKTDTRRIFRQQKRSADNALFLPIDGDSAATDTTNQILTNKNTESNEFKKIELTSKNLEQKIETKSNGNNQAKVPTIQIDEIKPTTNQQLESKRTNTNEEELKSTTNQKLESKKTNKSEEPKSTTNQNQSCSQNTTNSKTPSPSLNSRSRCNPRQISKHSSIAVKDKMKILNEL